ncbi:uncharacterized protein FIBRA_07090 [Fibroporia radiculosa]|uniref:Enoyl reductase (ER) domain-containing protein n=1 Tax=Fibroporia radiculosa TaxID=599839 RepID=J4H4F3_9APHY|nr:uncharacterized protein FIBRA_07090 [Fibroporia radiculosa]CCM04894.1 predicted protein [Fibroporia radiculosa]
MSRQKALFLTAAKGSFAVGTAAVPQPGPGQILIKIYATALNPVDWKIQVHDFFIREYPTILGIDIAGTVTDVGEGVSGFKLGDRVITEAPIGESDQASFQQFTLASVNVTAKIPASLSFEEAASIPLGLTTAAVGLYNRVGGIGLFPPWEEGGRGLYRGKPFVVMGGASSVGQYVIQLARLSGFNPIITTASKSNADYLAALGATHILDRSLSPDAIRTEVSKITSAPIEAIYDAVSFPETQNLAYDILAPGGCLIIDYQLAIDEARKTSDKRVEYVYGIVHAPAARTLGASLFAKLSHLLIEGAIRPNRVEMLPNGLEGIISGLERLQKGVSNVKLIALPQETS